MNTVAKKKQTEEEFDQDFSRAVEKALSADPKDVKVHITCRLDSDIYMELKSRAKKSNGKYQTLMNDLLREALFESEENSDAFDVVELADVNHALGVLRQALMPKAWSEPLPNLKMKRRSTPAIHKTTAANLERMGMKTMRTATKKAR